MGDRCSPHSLSVWLYGRKEPTPWASEWRQADTLRFKEDQLASFRRLLALVGSGLSKANKIGFWDSCWNC